MGEGFDPPINLPKCVLAWLYTIVCLYTTVFLLVHFLFEHPFEHPAMHMWIKVSKGVEGPYRAKRWVSGISKRVLEVNKMLIKSQV